MEAAVWHRPKHRKSGQTPFLAVAAFMAVGAGATAFLAVSQGGAGAQTAEALQLRPAAVQTFAPRPASTVYPIRPATDPATPKAAKHKAQAAQPVAQETPAGQVTTPVPAETVPSPVVVTPTAQATTQAPSPDPTTPSVMPTPTSSQTGSSPAVAPTRTVSGGGPLDQQLLAEAETQQGVPYVYAGDQPGGFDCSGLVYWAALQLGISGMPRDTYEMLEQGVSSGLLVETDNPQPGDLAFFGSGHVELYVQPGETFGAQKPGTDVDFHQYGGSWQPTAFYYVS
jgi:cell wall-associated NlpC family hydrolase